MRYLVQRVSSASVHIIDTDTTNSIWEGFLVYMWIHRDDIETDWKAVCEKFARRVKKLELFSLWSQRKKSQTFSDVWWELLLISNFTLYGRNKKGGSIDFTHSASFDLAKPIYDYQIECLEEEKISYKTWGFGAMMDVKSSNVGPVNIVLDW